VEISEPAKGHLTSLPRAAPFDMLLSGATGDLALRKFVPALYRRHPAGQIVAGVLALAVAQGLRSTRADHRGRTVGH
jgi:glucose-6-phosphate 1-dehydrogenase